MPSLNCLPQKFRHAIVFFMKERGDTAANFFNQTEGEEDPGVFVDTLAPGESSIVPKGYTVKSVSPTHPNTNFGGFLKAIVQKVAAAVRSFL